jgi:cytochrome c oxidase assembly factor CtaG
MIDDFDPARLLWGAAALLLLLAAVAAFAEYRRTRRRNLDRPGWVPWNLIQILAFMLAMIAAALALKL